MPGYRARILDEHSLEAADDASGRLFIAGDSIARCYWNNPERTEATMVGEWLDTGDTYRRDGEGYYYYCGRSDDMLKVGGIWCSPFEIESKLIEHPAVVEAAVVGRADNDELIKPEAFVVLKDGGVNEAALAAELLQLCKSGLAPYKYPRWINFVAELRRVPGELPHHRGRLDGPRRWGTRTASPHPRAALFSSPARSAGTPSSDFTAGRWHPNSSRRSATFSRFSPSPAGWRTTYAE